MRTQKTVNGVVHDYVLDGTRILADYSSGSELVFAYGENNTPQSFTYNGTKYNYVTNLQGDVMEIRDGANNVVGSYVYNAYGQIISSSGAMADVNPIRYRGYYYDAETGLFYVGSRYYDPEIGRFINADTTDVLIAIPMGLTDKNLFAYCDNNPVVRADSEGQFWHIVAGAAVGGLIGGISSIIGQAVSGNGINWDEVGVSVLSGVLTGAITAAAPGMGALATGLIHGAVGSGTYAATELVNGRTPTIFGTLAAGITSGVLASGAKLISNRLTTTKLYRSVSSTEAKSFSNTGKLSALSGQMEGKFFATSKANATTWGSKLGSNNIISIRVSNSALSHNSVTYFPRLDAIGPAYYFSDLSYLNSIFR